MGKFRVEVTKKARKQIVEHRKSGDKSSIKNIERILIELTTHPETGTGQPEKLKYELSGYWSRRINKKDRLIYSIDDNTVTVEVVSEMGHYLDR